MPELKSVKEIGRGRDWVKFLATWGPGVTFSQIRLWHEAWAERHSAEFGWLKAEVMPFSFGDNRAIFKFRTEPFSMKSNDFYRYIDAFAKSLGGPAVSEAKQEEPKFDTKSFIDSLFDTLRNVGPVAGIDFGSETDDKPYVTVGDKGDTINAPDGGDGTRSVKALENPPSLLTASNFRTTNDVRVRSLISRLKNS